MPVIKAGAFDLDYTDVGSGPAVVLVHSSASGNRQWYRLTEILRSRYRVIAVNLFGYGKTSAWRGARAMTVADQAELVAAAGALADEPVALVGHSLGGAVAFETAALLGDRVRLLVAFEPILFGHLRGRAPEAACEEIESLSKRFRALARIGAWNAAGEWFVDYWAAPGTWAAMSPERQQHTLAMLPAVVHEWDMATTGIRPLDGWRAITASVHLIHAADTRKPAKEVVRALAAHYPQWLAYEIPAGGHMAPLARPDLVNPLIATALDAAMLNEQRTFEIAMAV